MKKSLNILKTELAELRSEATELSTRSSYTPEDSERAEYLVKAIANHDKAIRKAEKNLGELRDLAVNNPDHIDGPTDRKYGSTSRDTAMRSIDAMIKRSGLPAEGAEKIEQVISNGPAHERSWAQRWATTAGSAEYERAYVKMLQDPQNAALRMTAEEQHAFRAGLDLAQEQRAMAVNYGGSGASGGYMVPTILDPAINLTNDGSNNPLRQISRVVQTTGSQWTGITSAGSTAEWVAEATEVADASPTVADPTIPVYKGDAYVPFSFELEGDAVDLLTQLREVLTDSADQLTATAYTTGAGSTQPTGLVTALVAAGGSVIVSGAGTEALDAQDPYKLQNALAPRWQANASFVAALPTLNAFRQFETDNGTWVFPELRNTPPTLLNRAVYENSNMDSTINAAATENNYLAVYGDFRQFVIVDRIGSTLEIVPHILGSHGRPTGQRGALLWFRTGSDVLIPNAFRLLKVATTA
ncbi:phage major capsid protein [Nocardia nova]|uniref:phage major capsid protein n=1 Tax=Nocardia nova TaxID=37330 RepID=UPI0033E83A85